MLQSLANNLMRPQTLQTNKQSIPLIEDTCESDENLINIDENLII